MPDVSFVNLLVVVAVAVLAPLAVGYLPRLRVPCTSCGAGCSASPCSATW